MQPIEAGGGGGTGGGGGGGGGPDQEAWIEAVYEPHDDPLDHVDGTDDSAALDEVYVAHCPAAWRNLTVPGVPLG
jgi:hypothetical protein